MARTINGKLRGRAAAEYRREVILAIEDANRERTQWHIDKFRRRQSRLIDACIVAEGEDAFWKWYDDNDNVPLVGRISERIKILDAHFADLKQKAAK